MEIEKPDKLQKVRPIINHLNEKFGSIRIEESMSVDEQMCVINIVINCFYCVVFLDILIK